MECRVGIYHCVAKGLASRLRLKLTKWKVHIITQKVAKGLASRLRLKRQFHETNVLHLLSRQGAGISPEIETLRHVDCGIAEVEVAKGLASRLRLKQGVARNKGVVRLSRQGAGISPEIETSTPEAAVVTVPLGRQGAGISPEIETFHQVSWPSDKTPSPRGWHLA